MIKRVLETMHIQVLEKPSFEADDILATLSSQASTQGMEVLICSGDRDSFQLVNESVTVLYPVKGVSEMARMTPSAVEAKYGVPPPQRYPDLAALVGESSDNLPGGIPVSARRRPRSGSPRTTVSRRRRPRRPGLGQGR